MPALWHNLSSLIQQDTPTRTRGNAQPLLPSQLATATTNSGSLHTSLPCSTPHKNPRRKYLLTSRHNRHARCPIHNSPTQKTKHNWKISLFFFCFSLCPLANAYNFTLSLPVSWYIEVGFFFFTCRYLHLPEKTLRSKHGLRGCIMKKYPKNTVLP